MTIEQLKRNDRFKFNDESFRVTRKFISDDKPLVAIEETTRTEHRFHWEGLEIVKLDGVAPTLTSSILVPKNQNTNNQKQLNNLK